MNPDELYAWILKEYERYKAGQITREDYEAKLKEYNEKITQLQQKQINEDALTAVENEIGVARTTSVAGLREQILRELRRK